MTRFIYHQLASSRQNGVLRNRKRCPTGNILYHTERQIQSHYFEERNKK